ncbi:hypothetical protein [Desulfopila sp. IMCC35008]|uniref:spermine/spermidine synthase domain-containing protein n=1 Tax=Desulfopila sp. IMCC35008 TaxID=2653858 RepID=UPI0013CF4E1D|nr:hypothetical protein [Desulfopila sp. IMCC35008]
MQNQSKKLVHKSMWGERLVEIYDRDDFRYLYFNSRFLQSKMSLRSPRHLALPYTRYMMLSLFFVPNPKRILLIGLGAGSLVRYLHEVLPESKIDAVDHSEQVIDLARGYFHLPDSARVSIHCQDGVDYIKRNRTNEPYDLILLDAFDEQGMADGIYSREFFELCARSLSPSGLLCCNLWSGKPEDVQNISRELTLLFPGQLTCNVPQRGNIINYSLPYSVKWHHFSLLRRRKKMLRDRFGLDYDSMTTKLIKNNLGYLEQMLLLLLG